MPIDQLTRFAFAAVAVNKVAAAAAAITRERFMVVVSICARNKACMLRQRDATGASLTKSVLRNVKGRPAPPS